jgi:hypothetical protein
MNCHITTLPDDILRCIGKRLVRTDRPIAATAKDCAAVAMSCKALSHVATEAWMRCAIVAECQPNLHTLAFRWGCIYRTANREHVYKIVRNLPGSNSRMTVAEMEALLRQPGGHVGESCPIAPKAARFIMDISWLPIHKSIAEKRFWDRDLSSCVRMTLSTLRYATVVVAPIKPDIVLAGERVAQRVSELEALDETLHAVGIQRQWGETNVLMHNLVHLSAWAKAVGLPPAMRDSVEAQLRVGGTFTPALQQEVLDFIELLAEFECATQHSEAAADATEPLRLSGYVARDVAYALSDGIQKRRLGKVMFVANLCFPLYSGQLSRADVVTFDSHITLVLECNAQADTETLAKFAHVPKIERYITDVSTENRIERSVVKTVELCRAWSVHEALEYAAVALLRAKRPTYVVHDDLAVAHDLVARYPAIFSDTVCLGDIDLRTYAMDAVCNATDSWAADQLEIRQEALHFAYRPASEAGLDAYIGAVRRGVESSRSANGDIVRLCVGRGVKLQGEKIAAWGQVLAKMSWTLADIRTTFPKLKLEADGHARAERAVEAYWWLVEHTDVSVCEDHVQTLPQLVAHWALKENVGNVSLCSRAAHGTVLVRHLLYAYGCTSYV